MKAGSGAERERAEEAKRAAWGGRARALVGCEKVGRWSAMLRCAVSGGRVWRRTRGEKSTGRGESRGDLRFASKGPSSSLSSRFEGVNMQR